MNHRLMRQNHHPSLYARKVWNAKCAYQCRCFPGYGTAGKSCSIYFGTRWFHSSLFHTVFCADNPPCSPITLPLSNIALVLLEVGILPDNICFTMFFYVLALQAGSLLMKCTRRSIRSFYFYSWTSVFAGFSRFLATSKQCCGKKHLAKSNINTT